MLFLITGEITAASGILILFKILPYGSVFVCFGANVTHLTFNSLERVKAI